MSSPLKSDTKMDLPKHLISVANSLLKSVKMRDGFLNDKRCSFFKGKHAVNALLRSPPKFLAEKTREGAESLLQEMAGLGMFIRVDKEPETKNLKFGPQRPFDPESFYVWVYQGSQMWGTLMGIGVLIVVFIGVLFPLWPNFMRQGAYYVSLLLMGFLGFLMVLGVFRVILWIVLLITIQRGGWLFPNLFADVGFFESFVPVWSWDKKKSKKSD